MIHVLAIITAKAGMRTKILEAFHANMPAVHAEKGCVEYGPAIDADGAGGMQAKFGADTFVVIEKWESLDALKAHAASAHNGRLRRQDPRHDRQPGDPRAAARVICRELQVSAPSKPLISGRATK